LFKTNENEDAPKSFKFIRGGTSFQDSFLKRDADPAKVVRKGCKRSPHPDPLPEGEGRANTPGVSVKRAAGDTHPG
jgi:hypothetical protein